jgi:hypothetical protein
MRLAQAERSEAVSLWRAYLERPRLRLALFEALKNDFLTLLHLRRVVGDDAFKHACHLFADVVIEWKAAFTGEETHDALHAMGSTGGRDILQRFGVRLERSDNQQGFWTTILDPWLKAHWPTVAAFRDEPMRAEASSLLLATREAFPDALDTLAERSLVGKVSDPSLLLYRLNRKHGARDGSEAPTYDYAANHPVEVCRWLARILPQQLNQAMAREYLADILRRIPRPSPDTAEWQSWKQLWDRSGCSPS